MTFHIDKGRQEGPTPQQIANRQVREDWYGQIEAERGTPEHDSELAMMLVTAIRTYKSERFLIAFFYKFAGELIDMSQRSPDAHLWVVQEFAERLNDVCGCAPGASG